MTARKSAAPRRRQAGASGADEADAAPDAAPPRSKKSRLTHRAAAAAGDDDDGEEKKAGKADDSATHTTETPEPTELGRGYTDDASSSSGSHSQIYEPFKSIIHKLSPQTYSEIIESDIGYYIIRIEDIITNSLSDMDIKKLETTHKKIIWNKKGTQLAKDFVDSFMSAKNVIIKSKSFNNLVKNTFGFYKNLGSIPLDDKIYSELDLHDNWLSDTLIVHRHGIVRTKQFLDFMKLRPIKYDIKTIDSFSNDLEEKLAIIIRDYFLILEYEENYNFNQSEILNQISQWKKKYVVEDYLQKLHYSFVKNNLEKNQFNNFLERKLDSLRSKINISINHELLSNVDVIDNVKSHIPELQLYKLGLPYLKKAYPTPHFMFSYINNPN